MALDNIRPPAFDQAIWDAARQRAAPIVGHIILNWTALDTGLVETIQMARMLSWVAQKAPPPNREVSHKFRERLNEWIRLALPPLGRQSEGDALRTEVLRLQAIRDDVAHNIRTMWLDDSGDVVAMVFKENTRFSSAPLSAKRTAKGIELSPTNPQQQAFKSGTYSEETLVRTIDDIAAAFMKMQQVREPLFKAIKYGS
jgi:hypothetical protein